MPEPKAPDVLLKCDGPGCLQIPVKAPRVYVPPSDHRHTPLTASFPHLSYCQACWDKHMKLDDLMTPEMRAKMEERGKKIWPHDVTPDFNAALIEPIDIYSPEYEAYMNRLGFKTDGLGFSLHKPVVHPRMPRG